MAFFKFRKPGGVVSPADVPVPNIEALRQRAKHRLVGATVLILAGVIGLPLLFDRQPRPIAVDTPIEIPDKNKVLPLVIPPAQPALPVAASTVKAPAAEPSVPSIAVSTPVVNPLSKQEDTPPLAGSAPAAPASSAAPTKPAKSVNSATASPPVAVNRAQALLDGQDAAAATGNASNAANADAPASPRFVVQVGAFADQARSQEVRLKVERSGLKTYTQVADTKDGKRIRVRVGPFATRAEAEKAAARIKKLDLPAAMLTL